MSDVSEAFAAGRGRGIAAGSWVFDGNTDRASVVRVVQGCEDGDPEILDTAPSPLSGEWAGESIPELSAEYGLDLEDDAVATAFSDGFSEGYWSEVYALAARGLGCHS